MEAVSYLLLLGATVIKRAGGTELGVTVFGPIHGVLFLVFAGALLASYRRLGWQLSRTVLAIIIGSLPFGGFWVERRWLVTASLVRTRGGPGRRAPDGGRR